MLRELGRSLSGDPVDVTYLVGIIDYEEIDFCAQAKIVLNFADCGSIDVISAVDSSTDALPDQAEELFPPTIIPDQSQGLNPVQIGTTSMGGVDSPFVFRLDHEKSIIGRWTITYAPTWASASSETQILEIVSPCRDRELQFLEPFLTGMFDIDYPELISDSPTSYIVEDYMNSAYGAHETDFLNAGGSCPDLSFVLSDSDLSDFPAEMLDGTASVLQYMADLDSLDGTYSAQLVVEYNPIHGTETLALQDVPLNFVVQNSCIPSGIAINDNTNAEMTLLTGTQEGIQGETDLTWSSTEFDIEGVDDMQGCPMDIYIGLQLLSAVDADGMDLSADLDLQGGPENLQFIEDETNQPVIFSHPEEITFAPKTTDSEGTYTYQILYFWGGISNPQYYFTEPQQYVFIVLPPLTELAPSTELAGAEIVCQTHPFTESECLSIECCEWNDDYCWSAVDQDECTVSTSTGIDRIALVAASSGTVDLCEEAKSQLNMSSCGVSGSSTTVANAVNMAGEDVEYQFDNDNPVIIIYDDNDTGAWQVTLSFISTYIDPPVTAKEVTYEVIVHNSCRDAALTLAGPFLSGIFKADFDEMGVETANDYLSCQDIDYGAGDVDGDTCAEYTMNPSWCESNYDYDDDDFFSGIMCCACDGGSPSGFSFALGTYQNDFIVQGGTCPETTIAYPWVDFLAAETPIEGTPVDEATMNSVVYFEGSNLIFKPEFTTELGTYRMQFKASYAEPLGDDTEIWTFYQQDWSFVVQNSCKPTSFTIDVYQYECTQDDTANFIEIELDTSVDIEFTNDEYECPVASGGLQLMSLTLADGTQSSSFNSASQGGPSEVEFPAGESNMPVAMQDQEGLLFEPTSNDEPGNYFYELQYFYAGEVDQTVYVAMENALKFVVEAATSVPSAPVGNSQPQNVSVEVDQDAIFQEAEALLLGRDAQPLWPFNLPINVNEETTVNLSAVVLYIDSVSGDSPNLEFTVDISQVEEFTEYNDNGQIIFEPEEDNIGTYEVFGELQDSNNHWEGTIPVTVRDFAAEEAAMITAQEEATAQAELSTQQAEIDSIQAELASIDELAVSTQEELDSFLQQIETLEEQISIIASALESTIEEENSTSHQETIEEQLEQVETIQEQLEATNAQIESALTIIEEANEKPIQGEETDGENTSLEEEDEESEENSEQQEDFGLPEEPESEEEEETPEVDYFEEDVSCTGSNVDDCSLFDNPNVDIGSLDADEVENYLDQMEESTITLDLGGVLVENINIASLTSAEGAVADIFDELDELDDEQQQQVFEELLQYNLKYLAERRVIECQNGCYSQQEEQVTTAMVFGSIDQFGTLTLTLNQDCIALTFLKDLDRQLVSPGIVKDSEEVTVAKRVLTEEESESSVSSDSDEEGERTNTFDLSQYLKFEVTRGGEDSSPIEDLTFNVTTAGVNGDQLIFVLQFANPTLVSIGSKFDAINVEVVKPEFFSSANSGLEVQIGFSLTSQLPKMLPATQFQIALIAATEAAETVTITAIILQIVVTVVISASLKSMWNLMNVIQIVAYMRFFARWPAFLETVFVQLDYAITLRPISNLFIDYGKSKFQKANETLQDENLRDSGVTDPSLVKSLGVFGFVFALLLIGVGIYFLLKWIKSMSHTNSKINTVMTFLDKKLFYSGVLRYMIVSNHKLTYTAFGFFVSSLAFTTLAQKGMTIGCGLVLIFLLVYPVAQMYFLLKYQDRLEEPKVRQRFSTLFDGMQTSSKLTMLYNSIFGMRRFYIVFINITLSPNCPWSNFEQHRYLYKILIFTFIQSLYIIYIIESKPHIVMKFNRLELFNEGALMCLGYVSLAFSGIVLGQSTDNLFAEVLAYLITAGIVIANFYTLFKGTWDKLKQSAEKKKLEKIAKEKMKKGNKVMIEPQFLTLDADETRTAPNLKSVFREKKFGQLAIITESQECHVQSISSQSERHLESESGDRKIPNPMRVITSEETLKTEPGKNGKQTIEIKDENDDYLVLPEIGMGDTFFKEKTQSALRHFEEITYDDHNDQNDEEKENTIRYKASKSLILPPFQLQSMNLDESDIQLLNQSVTLPKPSMFATREGRRNTLNNGEAALGLMTIEDVVTQLHDID